VVRELVRRGHRFFGLARSVASAAGLDQFAVTAIAGNIGAPEAWAAALSPLDAGPGDKISKTTPCKVGWDLAAGALHGAPACVGLRERTKNPYRVRVTVS